MLGVRLHLYVAIFACIASGQASAGQCVSSEKIDFSQNFQPGNRTYLGEKGLAIYEGSYIRNVLGISRALKLNPIKLNTHYDEFIKRRSLTRTYNGKLPSPEFAVKLLNEHSGLLIVSYDVVSNRLQIDERSSTARLESICSGRTEAKVIAAPIRHPAAASATQPKSIETDSQSSLIVVSNGDLGEAQRAITNSSTRNQTTQPQLMHFTTKEGETLKTALDRFASVSNLALVHEELGFKDLNLLLDHHTYSADTYIEILKSLLAQHSILVSVED